MSLAGRFLPNPDYGRGIYRRRIWLGRASRRVVASVLDDFHDMTCSLEHDGRTVVNVEGEVRRAPFTTCPGATMALRELIGLPLTIGRRDLYSAERPQHNCTHLFDIAALALAFATEKPPERQFDIVLPDESGQGAQAHVYVDGHIVHDWLISQETIAHPAAFAGRGLFGGFASWAARTFSGVELDAALMLQKAVFVARGRRYLVSQDSHNSLRDEPERLGACFTFSEPRFSIAQGVPAYVRDFTSGLPE